MDILVNNAGITRDMLTMMMQPNDFSDVIDLNLKVRAGPPARPPPVPPAPSSPHILRRPPPSTCNCRVCFSARKRPSSAR